MKEQEEANDPKEQEEARSGGAGSDKRSGGAGSDKRSEEQETAEADLAEQISMADAVKSIFKMDDRYMELMIEPERIEAVSVSESEGPEKKVVRRSDQPSELKEPPK